MEVLAFIAANFRSVQARGGCVVNSLLFEDWFRQEALTGSLWARQMGLRVNTPSGALIHHRVVLFEAGMEIYLYDSTFGALRLPGAGRATRIGPVITEARAVMNAVIAGSTAPQGPVRRLPSTGDLLTCLHARLAPRRLTAVVTYRTHRVLAFLEGRRISVYDPAFGTAQAMLIKPDPKGGLRSVLAALYGGAGRYQLESPKHPLLDLPPESYLPPLTGVIAPFRPPC